MWLTSERYLESTTIVYQTRISICTIHIYANIYAVSDASTTLDPLYVRSPEYSSQLLHINLLRYLDPP